MNDPSTPEAFFAGHPLGLDVLERLLTSLDAELAVEVHVSRSQVALRRRRGFAYLWLPGQYLRPPQAELVLSVVLGRHDPSPRFKQVVHPSPGHWMHHLEVRQVTDVDTEVLAWVREAAERAG